MKLLIWIDSMKFRIFLALHVFECWFDWWM